MPDYITMTDGDLSDNELFIRSEVDLLMYLSGEMLDRAKLLGNCQESTKLINEAHIIREPVSSLLNELDKIYTEILKRDQEELNVDGK